MTKQKLKEPDASPESSFGKAGTNPTGKMQSFRLIVTDKQSAKVFAAAFRRGVTANDERLLLGQFDFDPGALAPAGCERWL